MSKESESETRPRGVTALSLFFFFGAAMSFIACVSLLFPGSLLEPMWRLNPMNVVLGTEVFPATFVARLVLKKDKPMRAGSQPTLSPLRP